MDPSRNYNSQNPNIRPPYPGYPMLDNSQNNEWNHPLNAQYAMPPPNYMNYPYNHPYMPYGYQPMPGNSYVPTPTSYPQNEPATDLPEFSTQISLGEDDGDAPTSFVGPLKKSTKNGSYESWTTDQNIALVLGYFHASNDSEIGNNQKSDSFWAKVTDFVQEKTGVARNKGQCRARFTIVNKALSSFVGYYSLAKREVKSGWSNDDYISKALELWNTNEGKKFTLLEEWKTVRHQPRYRTGGTESGSSGSKRKSDSDSVESSNFPLVLLEGREKTKMKKGKRSKIVIDEEFAELRSFRESEQKSKENELAIWARTNELMLDYAKSNNNLARVKSMEMFMELSKNSNRDECEEKMYEMLKKEIFG